MASIQNFFSSSGGIIVFYVLIFAAIYLLLIRPSSKRKKEEQAMRSNIKIGDDITTIGGIVGRVVAVKDEEDAYVIETGSDRVKMKIKKWGISSVDTVKEPSDKEKELQELKEKKAKEKAERKAAKKQAKENK